MASVHSQDDIFKLEQNHSGIIATKSGFVQLKGVHYGRKQVYLKDDQAFVRARHPKRIEFTPVTATSVNFGGSTQVTEFRIYEQDDFESVLNMTLRGTITKTAATLNAAQLAEPAPLWIDRLEVLVNGSTTIIHTMYGDQIWNNLSTLPTEQLKTLLGNNLLYMGSDFKVNNAISTSTAASTTWGAVTSGTPARMFAIPIFGTVLEKLRLRALDGDTIVRIHWNPLIGNILSGSQTPASTPSSAFALSNLELILESEEVLAKDKIAFMNLAKSSVFFVKFIEPVVQTFTQALTVGNETAYQLTSFYGNFVALQVYIRDTAQQQHLTFSLAPTHSTLVDDVHPTYGRISFTDSSNKQLFTPNGFKPYDLRFHQYSQHMPNEWPNSIPWYQLPLCETPVAAIQKGVIDGYVTMGGSEYVRIQPASGSTFSVSNQKIVVVGWKIKVLKIEDGKASLI